MTISISLDSRLDKIVRKHEKMRRNGVVHSTGPDGLVRAHPRLVRRDFPIKGTVLAVAILIAFKSLLFAQMGTGTYNARVDVLQAGSSLEQVGAIIMQEDPVTVAIGDFLNKYIF